MTLGWPETLSHKVLTGFQSTLSQYIPRTKSNWLHLLSLTQTHPFPSISHTTGHSDQSQLHPTIPEGSLPISPQTGARCATTCHLHHLIGHSFRWWTWDLTVPTLFILNLFSLHANTSLIALQQSYAYLFSFPTWRPIVFTPVLCSHPHLFHLHVDSRLSYRYPPASVPIVYVSLWSCGSVLYK